MSGACGVCGTPHARESCPTLIRALGGADRTTDLAPLDGKLDPMLGRELGGWELLGVLGEGSFGVVYRAVHRETRETAAVKLLHKELVDNVELVRRFVGEARATLLVQHENVVQVKAIDLIDGKRYFIALELLTGETLESRCLRGPVPFEEAAPLLRQICDGLSAAHSVGIVHRDLKPENVYLSSLEHKVTVKVMDFGVARRSHLAVGEARTGVGVVIGTPQYLSPEQSLGLEVDRRTDVYSLGVIAFRMLTGRLPFTHADATQLIIAHRVEAPPRPTAVLPSLPPLVDALVGKALVKDPDQRYQSMADFEAAIARAEADYLAARPRIPPWLALVESMERVPPGDHYRLFDVEEGAAADAIRAAADRLEERLTQAREDCTEDLVARVDVAAGRVQEARGVLLNALARVKWDAGRGNFVGVARELATGFDVKLLEALRELYLLDHPELEAPGPLPAVPPLPLGDNFGMAEAAAAELARRLKDDPLNLGLHRHYWPLRGALKEVIPEARTLPA